MSKQSKYPPFATARLAALDLHLKSQVDWLKWHKKNNPPYLPRYPNRVYTLEFISWNDWLGNDNKFGANQPRDWRPYWEAVKFAQKYASDNNINNMQGWMDHLKKKDSTLPDDIPRRPDQTYKEFIGNGWPIWLGTTARSKLKVANVNTHIFAICSTWSLTTPGNYYHFVHAKNGVTEMKQKLGQGKNVVVYAAYYWQPDLAEEVLRLFKVLTRDEGGGLVYCPNIDNLVFELDVILLRYNPEASKIPDSVANTIEDKEEEGIQFDYDKIVR
jgi:hypothetical protein